VVLNKSAAAPKAVLLSAVLKRRVPAPVAVLKLPAASLKSEYQPTAVFAEPVVCCCSLGEWGSLEFRPFNREGRRAKQEPEKCVVLAISDAGRFNLPR